MTVHSFEPWIGKSTSQIIINPTKIRPQISKVPCTSIAIAMQVCKVAPVPGETKVWQYITLTKRIFLIDCPGVVSDRAGNTDTDAVLKGIARIDKLVGACFGDFRSL